MSGSVNLHLKASFLCAACSLQMLLTSGLQWLLKPPALQQRTHRHHHKEAVNVSIAAQYMQTGRAHTRNHVTADALRLLCERTRWTHSPAHRH